MAWDIGSWLVCVRSIQLLGTLVCAACNGSLLAYIIVNGLGTSQDMVVLEWTISVILCYTGLNLLILHTRGRSTKTGWIVAFIVVDLLSTGALVAIITLLSRAGVPSHCAGLTRDDPASGDSDDYPDPGFSTTRFSDQSLGKKGELDKYCALERAYYFIVIGILYSYMATICLAILRICQFKYTNNKRVLQVMDTLHGSHSGYELVGKLEEQRLKSASTPRIPPPAPPSEGITSPRISMRPVSRSPQSPHHVTQNIPDIATPSAPMQSPTISMGSPPPPPGLGIASDDSEDRLAAAAMITDGATFDGGYQPGMSTLPPYSPASPVQIDTRPPGSSSESPLGDYGSKGERRI